MKMTAGRDGTALKDLSACDAPPMRLCSIGEFFDLIQPEKEEERQATDKTAEAIQIGDGRYALIVHCAEGKDMRPQDIERLRRGLARWWDSGEKFVILQDGAWGTFTFERMPDE